MILFASLLMIGCQEYGAIDQADPSLSYFHGLLVQNGNVFTGKIIQKNDALSETYITTYQNGLEHGEYIAKKNNGTLVERRFFLNGEKEGIYESWYENGNRKVYAEFKKGTYINDHWTWYENGKPSKYEKYNEEGKILATKIWNKAGNIYMNLSFYADGSSVGLPGSKICSPIKGKSK